MSFVAPFTTYETETKGKAAKYWEKYLTSMEDEDGTDERDDGFCDAYVFLSSYYIEQRIDLKLGEEYARKCVEFLPTREHGTKLLNALKIASDRPVGVKGMLQCRKRAKGIVWPTSATGQTIIRAFPSQ